jgi:acetoin utilization protein AcuC
MARMPHSSVQEPPCALAYGGSTDYPVPGRKRQAKAPASGRRIHRVPQGFGGQLLTGRQAMPGLRPPFLTAPGGRDIQHPLAGIHSFRQGAPELPGAYAGSRHASLTPGGLLMKAPEVVLIHSEEIEQYHYPDACPFKAERARMMRETLVSTGLLFGARRSERAPVPATRNELLTFHTRRYLDVLRRSEEGELDTEGLFMGLGTEETPVFRGMYDYAALACGATLTGARLVLAREADRVFNPSGGFHHAGPEKAAGFCYMNDVALACLELAATGKRVLSLDLDVHHGDGVQDAFYDRADVMTMSFHESGETLFPWRGSEGEIGEGKGRGYNVNVPFPAGTYDEAWLAAFREVAVPLARAYAPDVVLMEVGMDCLSGDPLAHLALTNNAYADAVGLIAGLGAPMVLTGGGGYNPPIAARGWALVWSVLCGEDDAGGMDHALGGVMLESTDWRAGLRDRALVTTEEQRRAVGPAVRRTIDRIRTEVFPLHGL